VCKAYARWILIGLAVLVLFSVGLYNFPPIHQRLAWRVASLQTRIYYLLNPPDQVALSPVQLGEINVRETLDALATAQALAATEKAPTFTPTPFALSPTPTPTQTPQKTPTPTPSPTPLPAQVSLVGIRHEWQSFNNCGPANLAMALSYWGWQGDQRTTKAFLRPNVDDPNVMPEEMAAFVHTHTNLDAVIRVGGTLEILKKLVAAGFPVILEIGHHPPDDWWMGHYIVVSGYNDLRGVLITQDSLIMPNLPRSYQEFEERWWRDFNHLYMVIFPPDRESEVMAILGEDSDSRTNLERALQRAEAEIPHLSGRDQFFALYNQGANLFKLGRVQESAAVFDLAFSHYQTIPAAQRPWRVVWYRMEAYQAYYETGRYQNVIDMANAAISTLRKRGLEESHYWRGMAHEALGDRERAKNDFQIALQIRPTFDLALAALGRLEETN